MAGEYLLPADFRPDTTAAACMGLTLDQNEAPSNDLTTQIASVSQRIDDLCNDHFSSVAGGVLELTVADDSYRLDLPQRFTAVTTIKIRDHAGTLVTQDALAYRLRSSLDTTGAIKLNNRDYVEVLQLGPGLAGADVYNAYSWPCGTQTVQVTGTYGWTTTPGDVKRVVAMLVWDHFKRESGDVRRASRWARGDLTVERASDSETGLPEADDLLRPYIRGDGGGDAGELLVLVS